MKRTLTTIVIIALTVGAIMAQPRAVGVRAGYNFEASYQHEVGLGSGMVEVDAGISPFLFSKGYYLDIDGNRIPTTYRYGRAQLVVFYDWKMSILTNLNWYVGVGAGVSWGYGVFFDSPHYNNNGSLTTYAGNGNPFLLVYVVKTTYCFSTSNSKSCPAAGSVASYNTLLLPSYFTRMEISSS